MKTEITPTIKERFRTVPGQFISFPENIDLSQWHIKGYFHGSGMYTCKDLTLDNFDSLIFHEYSTCTKTLKTFMHVHGYVQKTNSKKWLVLELNEKFN